MTIEKFLQDEILRPRADKARALVVYDPAGLYHGLVLAMATPRLKVIDAQASIIDARSAAALALADLGARRIDTMIIWTPTPRPLTDEGKKLDPFAAVAAVGEVFPAGAGDSYKALCLRARPENAVGIQRLFEGQEAPSFALINALGGSTQFVQLQAALGLTQPDTRAIFEGLLCPTPEQAERLRNLSWLPEAKQCLQDVLGVAAPSADLASLQDYLWLVLLFSEFYFDSSRVDLPAGLRTVPRAADGAQPFVYQLCDGLRAGRFQDTYIERANRLADQLGLEQQAVGMRSLGERDTFAFEESYFLDQFVAAIKAQQWSPARALVEIRRRSMWINVEAYQARKVEWEVAGRSLDLLEKLAEFTTLPSDLPTLVEHYVGKLCHADRLHRYLESVLVDRVEHHQGLDAVITLAREAYVRFTQRLHAATLAAVTAAGWPLRGLEYLENSELFDKVVEPLLESREPNRVAYFLVDALRFELARDLEQQLVKRYQVELKVACAQLPTYTEIGMASLMPKAKGNLALKLKDGELTTYLGDMVATDPQKRFAWMKSQKGDRCQDLHLEELIGARRPIVAENVNLLLVRDSSIDASAEKSEELTMRIIPKLLNNVQKGIQKLQEMGFTHVVIATDHGFMLNMDVGAGTTCEYPEGEWTKHTKRCVLGRGTPDSANAVLARTTLGIPGEFEHLATPRAFTSYRSPKGYFHEGISLQENVLPRIVVKLATPSVPQRATMEIAALYKGGKTKFVTTRRPFIDVIWSQAEMFATEVELRVVAQDAAGQEIGWVVQGDHTNPATGYLRIRPGQLASFCLRLEEAFAGPFTVSIVDPVTQQSYAKLELETQFHR